MPCEHGLLEKDFLFNGAWRSDPLCDLSGFVPCGHSKVHWIAMLRYPSKEGLNGEVASPRAIQHPVSRAVRKPVRSPGLSLCLLRSH